MTSSINTLSQKYEVIHSVNLLFNNLTSQALEALITELDTYIKDDQKENEFTKQIELGTQSDFFILSKTNQLVLKTQFRQMVAILSNCTNMNVSSQTGMIQSKDYIVQQEGFLRLS